METVWLSKSMQLGASMNNTLTKTMPGMFMLALASVGYAQTLTFSDQSGPSGIVANHSSTPRLGMQFMTPGGAVGDFNSDGFPDVLCLGGSAGVDRLFINQGNGTFIEEGAAWGINATHAGSGAAAADFDGDGDIDIYITSHGYAPSFSGDTNILYRNNGNGTFTDIAAQAGVRATLLPGMSEGDAFSPCWGDYDLDGDLDLAVAGWYGSNRLFRNNGDGTFTDATASIATDMSLVRGFTPTFQDINGDRYPELLWVADFYTSRLLINNGDGSFNDGTAGSGTGLDSNGMGSTVGDFNDDGLMDWYATSRINQDGTSGSGNMLYINDGDETFTESSVAAGVNRGDWGWGTEAADFNNDGLLDLVATNGWDGTFFSVDPTRIFLNNGDGTFFNATASTSLNHTGQGRGLAVLDADADGDMDLLIFCNNEPLGYFENQLTGPNTNWIQISFDTSNRADIAPHGYGTSVEISAASMTQTRWMDGGSSYLANSQLMVHVGLGSASMVDELTVTWPTGETTVLTNVSANQRLVISAPEVTCIADFAPPEGVLDFFDVIAFLGAFSSQSPAADLAPPTGVFDFFDVVAYLAAFSQGCP